MLKEVIKVQSSSIAKAPEEFMLTTLDNPFNPFTQYDEWYTFDVSKGYYTCGYIARIAKSSDELSSADESLAISYAVDEILDLNVTGLYIKVTRESFRDRTTAQDR
jgi:hypothetical protein